MPRGPRLQKLTFSLLREGSTRGDVFRRELDGVHSYVVSAIDTARPSLFVASKPPYPPPWQNFLAPHVTGKLEGLFAASSSAVLLIERAERLFAVTFGQGRHLLDSEALVYDFGLRVVLNTVAPDQLKSVDARTVDETPMHTRLDRSRDSSFSAFGLDVSRDLLRAVTGTPRDQTLASRLTGADSLGISTRAQVPDLPALAERLLTASQAEDYKEHFEFIDFMRPEKEPGRLRELEERLITALANLEIADVHLAAPEPVDWLDIEGFRFSTQDEEDDAENDPRITTYLESRAGDEVSLALLKQDQMLAIRASDHEPQRRWSVFRSIVYEVQIEDQLYVLSAGQWFRVNVDFKDQVEEDLNRLTVLEGLPDAEPGTDEDAYNLRAAEVVGGLCLDKKFVYEGGPDKMEICDILTREGGLIHVKQRGSSSTLSHLFTQGVNSAERLLTDGEFRTAARAVASAENPEFADVLPVERPDPGAHEVSFVVITRSARDTFLTLPFFSAVSLRAAARRLQASGFRVSVAAVRERVA
jgi:uncharacterized protein (TIGR04141 family)